MDIDELGRVVKKGFDKSASKEDVVLIRGDVKSLQKEVKGINNRLDRIERHILEDHAERIKRIEDAIGLSIKK